MKVINFYLNSDQRKCTSVREKYKNIFKIECFSTVHSYLFSCITLRKEMRHLKNSSLITFFYMIKIAVFVPE